MRTPSPPADAKRVQIAREMCDAGPARPRCPQVPHHRRPLIADVRGLVIAAHKPHQPQARTEDVDQVDAERERHRPSIGLTAVVAEGQVLDGRDELQHVVARQHPARVGARRVQHQTRYLAVERSQPRAELARVLGLVADIGKGEDLRRGGAKGAVVPASGQRGPTRLTGGAVGAAKLAVDHPCRRQRSQEAGQGNPIENPRRISGCDLPVDLHGRNCTCRWPGGSEQQNEYDEQPNEYDEQRPRGLKPAAAAADEDG